MSEVLNAALSGDFRPLARLISIVENSNDPVSILSPLKINRSIPLFGITGPPGAGKSTLINALLHGFDKLKPGARMGVISVDPTSPFTKGSLLGDRLRMQEHSSNKNIYIRSLATRGALGGLSARAVEVSDVMRSAGFDYIFIETAGVGQAEVDVVGVADVVVVVMVPESGDDVQAIKSGIMEIADVFAVNKSDRQGASDMVRVLTTSQSYRKNGMAPVVKTIATTSEGVNELVKVMTEALQVKSKDTSLMAAEHAYRLIQSERMKDIAISELQKSINKEMRSGNFNIYDFLKKKYF